MDLGIKESISIHNLKSQVFLKDTFKTITTDIFKMRNHSNSRKHNVQAVYIKHNFLHF